MFNKNQTSSDRLNTWRTIRQQEYLTVEPLLEAFANIKPIPRYIDYYTPSDWPNVFEIVSEGYLCQSGITLILAATLSNKGFITADELYFEVISNHINGNDGLVLIHEQVAYNFIPGETASLQYVIDNSTRFNSHKIKTSSLFS
tara:strand:- start:924 stop:1355 length:432 start_codon:yes stop_codon:yes gene_type:complete